MARQRRQATVLSEGDAAVLRRLIDQAKKLEVDKPSVSVVLQADDTLGRNFQAPEVYIALIPEEGIPGVSISPGVGTGTGSGTGSSLAVGDGDRVTSAFCNIYEILLGLSVGSGVLEDKELVYRGFSEKVYNLSRSTIPTGYAIIQRDKWGQFVVTPGGVSSRRKAVITQLGGIQPEESGEVQIWSGRPTVATDVFENAWLDWLYVDDGLPEGQRVYIEKFEGDEEYTITEPWC